MKSVAFAVAFIVIYSAIGLGQNLRFGFCLGPNLTFIGLSSNVDVLNNDISMTPFVGGQVDFLLRKNIRKKHILDGWLGLTVKSHTN